MEEEQKTPFGTFTNSSANGPPIHEPSSFENRRAPDSRLIALGSLIQDYAGDLAVALEDY